MNNESEQIFLLNPTGNQPSASHKLEEAPVAPQDVGDFSTVCRTCATVTEFVIPIFDGEGLQNNLAEKIHKHLPIQVSESDVLPRVVCYQCASTLLAWHELVQCCVQADAALRTRLAVAAAADNARTTEITEAKSSSKETDLNSEQAINKFEHVGERAEEAGAEAEAEAGACAYCDAGGGAGHLVAAHSDRLFHCDECDTYVDRKDFILHMSLHAVEYAAEQEKTEPSARVRKIRRRKSEARDVNENEDDAEKAESAAPRENEFSDHSDTEYGFGPLPESVFEAIEDSQDARPPPPAAAKPHKRPRTCPTCGKVYTASSSYFYHMKHSHGEGGRQHACGVCEKRFASRGALATHAATHSGERAHACKHCGKRFASRAGAYIHAQTHSSSKRWACAQCGRTFRWRAALTRHGLRHAGVRSHSCSRCGRGFSVRADLLRHARTHAAVRLACDHCGRSFAQPRYLKVHIERKHANEKKTDDKVDEPAVLT